MNKATKLLVIEVLLGPYIEQIITKYKERTPAGLDRIKKFKTLMRKLVRFFQTAQSYHDLDKARQWKEFQRHCENTLSSESMRIVTQDLNTLLDLLHKDLKIKRIKLPPVARKHAASQGFHIERLLDFNTEDVKKLWDVASEHKKNEYFLLFVLILCTCIQIRHLTYMKASGVHEKTVDIRNNGAINSFLLEPGRSMLLRYLDVNNLEGDKMLFKDITTTSFNTWLTNCCVQAGIPLLNAEKLWYYARFLRVIGGCRAYNVACCGAKNGFSPLEEESINRLEKLYG